MDTRPNGELVEKSLTQTAFCSFLQNGAKGHSYKLFLHIYAKTLGSDLLSLQERFARADADLVEHAAFLEERPKEEST